MLCIGMPIAHAFTPNDPFFSEQDYLLQINADKAWDITQGEYEVVVAVIDTAVALNHPDISYWINKDEVPNDGIDNDQNGYVDDVKGWDFFNNDNDVLASPPFPEDLGGIHHGTVVSGVIGALGDNNLGIAGISWKTKIMPIQVANKNGDGSAVTLAKAVEYAVDNGADVINISLVSDTEFSLARLQDAVTYARENDVWVVVAAGNGSDTFPNGINLNEHVRFPVCFANDNGEPVVIGVSAVDRDDTKAFFSNYGSDCVAISAPGTAIYSSLYFDPVFEPVRELFGGEWYGTSFSAPIITGALAYAKSINPRLTAQQQLDLLISSTDTIDDLNSDYSGELGGRLNLEIFIKNVVAFTQESRRSLYVVSPYARGDARIALYSEQMELVGSFNAYNSNFQGGVRVETFDVNQDGQTDIITAPGPGGGPHIRVFDIDGNIVHQFFAYDDNFTGGVEVEADYVTPVGDGTIVTAPGAGHEPLIRIFDPDGNVVHEFLAYASSMQAGIHVAVADIDNDGEKEIITLPYDGTDLRVYNWLGVLEKQYLLLDGSQSFNFDVGDSNNDGQYEIVLGTGKGRLSQIYIFDSKGQEVNRFNAYGNSFRGGVTVEVVDGGILVGPESAGGPHVRMFDIDGNVLHQFFAGSTSDRTGLNVDFAR